MSRLTNKSKFLSLLLRHKPEEAGIDLDHEGWASVKQLISKAGFTQSDLDTIVATDNKGRYSFSADKMLIRANQGHSLQVDLKLTLQIPPKVLYHGTARRFCDVIKKEGLVKQSRTHVHLSTSYETAIAVGKRRDPHPTVFYIDSKGMQRDGYAFYLSNNGVWLIDHVPPQYLRTSMSSENE